MIQQFINIKWLLSLMVLPVLAGWSCEKKDIESKCHDVYSDWNNYELKRARQFYNVSFERQKSDTSYYVDINYDGIADYRFHIVTTHGPTPSYTTVTYVLYSLSDKYFILDRVCSSFPKKNEPITRGMQWVSSKVLYYYKGGANGYQTCMFWYTDPTSYLGLKGDNERLGWLGIHFNPLRFVDQYFGCSMDTIYAGLRE